jgi:hypothetical protein
VYRVFFFFFFLPSTYTPHKYQYTTAESFHSGIMFTLLRNLFIFVISKTWHVAYLRIAVESDMSLKFLWYFISKRSSELNNHFSSNSPWIMRKSSGVQCSFSLYFVISSVCDSCFTHDFFMSKKHCYHDSYVQYGIIFMLDEDASFAGRYLARDIWSHPDLKNTCRLPNS